MCRKDAPLDTTDENTKSKLIDRVAELYIKMRGYNVTVSNGEVTELIERAERQGA